LKRKFELEHEKIDKNSTVYKRCHSVNFNEPVEADKDNNLNAPQSSREQYLKEKDKVELSEKTEGKSLYQRCHSDNFNEPNIKPDPQKSLAELTGKRKHHHI